MSAGMWSKVFVDCIYVVYCRPLCLVTSFNAINALNAILNACLAGKHQFFSFNFYMSRVQSWVLRVLPVAVTGSPNLLCCILRYFTDFAFCCCVI